MRRSIAISAESSWLVIAAACGSPEGQSSDSSHHDESTSSDSSSTTSTPDGTSSAGSSTRGADESSSTDAPITFIEGPDGGGTSFECDLWKNDCPSGEKCMPWIDDDGNSWNATKCTPLARDPKAPGEACEVLGDAGSGTDDCEAFAMCFFVDRATNEGVCVAFCRGSKANPVCEDRHSHCKITDATVLPLCLPECDPLVQNCTHGSACYPQDDHFECAPDASGRDGAAGDACEFLNVCDPGVFCAGARTIPGCETSGCCTPFCDLSARINPCPLLTECVPWYDDGQAPPSYENVGSCMEAP